MSKARPRSTRRKINVPLKASSCEHETFPHDYPIKWSSEPCLTYRLDNENGEIIRYFQSALRYCLCGMNNKHKYIMGYFLSLNYSTDVSHDIISAKFVTTRLDESNTCKYHVVLRKQ